MDGCMHNKDCLHARGKACVSLQSVELGCLSLSSLLRLQVSTSLRRGLYMSLLNVIRGEADPLQVRHDGLTAATVQPPSEL